MSPYPDSRAFAAMKRVDVAVNSMKILFHESCWCGNDVVATHAVTFLFCKRWQLMPCRLYFAEEDDEVTLTVAPLFRGRGWRSKSCRDIFISRNVMMWQLMPWHHIFFPGRDDVASDLAASLCCGLWWRGIFFISSGVFLCSYFAAADDEAHDLATYLSCRNWWRDPSLFYCFIFWTLTLKILTFLLIVFLVQFQEMDL